MLETCDRTSYFMSKRIHGQETKTEEETGPTIPLDEKLPTTQSHSSRPHPLHSLSLPNSVNLAAKRHGPLGGLFQTQIIAGMHTGSGMLLSTLPSFNVQPRLRISGVGQ